MLQATQMQYVLVVVERLFSSFHILKLPNTPTGTLQSQQSMHVHCCCVLRYMHTLPLQAPSPPC
jgi:hypothetical protein